MADGDPYFVSVVLLLHLDGVDGSTTFTDSSARHAMTANGGAVLTTAQQKFGTASLNPSSGAVVTGTSVDFQFGSGSFTVEAFVRPTATVSGFRSIVAVFGGAANLGWFFGFNGNNLGFYYSTTGTDNPAVGAAYAPTLNAWFHAAADRDANNVLRVYVNGVVLASAAVSATFFNSTQALLVGNDNNFSRNLIGQIDEVRITKGVARYAGAFTPPTAPFPDVLGTDAALGGGMARFSMRRRTMRMINDNPRLARKLGIRGKLQALD